MGSVNSKATSSPYLLHLELMRIFACFFVIFNHTRSWGFFLFAAYPQNSLKYWIYIFFSIFCKLAVPLYFSISGALLLGKQNESLSSIWKKRISKIATVLVVFSLISFIQLVYLGYYDEFSLKTYLVKLYSSSDLNYSYWYLYAFIVFLMGLPFSRAIAKVIDSTLIRYIVAINVIFVGIMPVLQYCIFQDSVTMYKHIRSPWFIADIVVYPLLGYYMENNFSIPDIKKLLPKLWLLNIVFITISSIMTTYKMNILGDTNQTYNQTFHSSFVIINCITIFFTLKYIYYQLHLTERMQKIILSLGKNTFGVYLIHLLVMNVKAVKNTYYVMRDHINDMIAVFLYVLVIMTVSYVIIYLIKKIPIVRKYL